MNNYPAKLLLTASAILAIFNLQPSTGQAQTALITYQGRVQDNGTNFSGAGQFEFALVTSTNANHQATATANLSGTFVTSYNLISGGNGYVSAPAVYVTGGGGSGATATAVISGGVVTAINPGNAGSGYTSAPTVTIDAPPADIAYTTYWSNDGTSSAGSEPAAAVGVTVNDGLFTVALGDTTLANMTALNASVFQQPDLELRIWFSDGVNGFAVLSPVQNLTSAPYAVSANTASNLNGTLPVGQLAGTLAVTQLPASLVTNGESGATLNSLVLAGTTQVNGDLTLNDNRLFFVSGDTNEGMSYVDVLPGFNLPGPFLFGFYGGGLGTVNPMEVNLTWDYLGDVWVSNGLTAISMIVDRTGQNGGSVRTNALTFGASSGEGIASQRLAGSGENPDGLDFYTAFTKRLSIANNGFVGINTTSAPTETLEINGATRLDDNDLYFRTGTDYNHGLGYRYTNTVPANAVIDGPFLYGYNGGALGVSDPDSTALQWDYNGNVWVSNKLSALSVNVDNVGQNGGSVSTNSLTFGINSGEGIASKRTAGIGQYGLDLYTAFTLRLRVNQNGNIGIGTTNSAYLLAVGNGASPAYCNGTTWENGSDRNIKSNFAPVNPVAVLDKVAALPINTWNYTADHAGVTHLGPVAQDFHAAFGLNGADDKHIATVDEEGVALAAIQGLNQKLEEQKAENAELKARLEKLERLLEQNMK